MRVRKTKPCSVHTCMFSRCVTHPRAGRHRSQILVRNGKACQRRVRRRVKGARMTVFLEKYSYKRLSDAHEVAMAAAAANTDTPRLPALLLLRSEDPPTLMDCISVIETRGCKHAATIICNIKDTTSISASQSPIEREAQKLKILVFFICFASNRPCAICYQPHCPTLHPTNRTPLIFTPGLSKSSK